MPKDMPKPKRAKAPAAELNGLAQYLAEALRVTRRRPDIPARLHNDIAGVCLEFQNRTPNEHLASDAEEVIKRRLTRRHRGRLCQQIFSCVGFKRLSRAAGF